MMRIWSCRLIMRVGTQIIIMAASATLAALSAAIAQESPEKPVVLPSVEIKAPYISAVPDRATTATKTDTPLKDIPASIQVVPKEVLSVQGAYNLDGVLKNVSGATQASGTNYGFFNSYLLRGLEQKFLRDGIPDGPSVNGYTRSLVNVERIEVLKGPSSALYGSSQPGGVVNVISKQPLTEPLYSLYQSVGSFKTFQSSVDFGGPIGTQKVLYRFNGSFYTSDGFRDLRNRSTEIFPAFAWRPNDRHSLTLNLDYRKLKVVPDNNGIPFRGTSILDVPLREKYYSPFSDTDQEVLRGAIHYDLKLTDGLVVRNNFAVLHRDLFLGRNESGTVAAGSSTMTGRRFREEKTLATDIVYQLEPVWKVRTGSIKHTLLGGFEYQLNRLGAKRRRASLPNIANVFAPVIPETSLATLAFTPLFDRDITNNQFGLYAQEQVEFSEQWKGSAGIRFDRFEAEQTEHLTPKQKSRSDNKVGTNVGVAYQPVKWTSLYAAFSRSHFASFSAEGGARSPERGTELEVGNKSTFLDGLINVNLALFHVTRENFIITIGGVENPIGEQRTQGFEFDLASEPRSGWKLNANYAFLDAKLTKLAPGDQNVGHRAPGVPRHSLGLWTTYELQTGPLRGFGFGGGVTYKGSNFATDRNTVRIPSFTVGDLAAFYRRGIFEARVNINNFTDEQYFRNALFGGATPGEPLTVLGTLRLSF